MESLSTKRCLVAVGSTQFDELIQALDSKEFIKVLEKKGFTHLFI